jgi:hypothetical protein
MENNPARSTNVKSHGKLTVEIAKRLQDLLKDKGYDVLYDHGDSSNKNVGTIVSWYGDGKKPERETELSQLDLAIVEQSSNHTIALVEIEETNDTPKTLMGDVFCALMGDHINFREKPLPVGVWTTLIIVGFSRVNHEKRIQHILAKVERIKPALSTKNSSIGKVIIKTFSDEAKLPALLQYELDKVFKGGCD